MQAQVLCDSYLNLLPTLKQDVCIHLAAADDGLAVESRAYKTGRRHGHVRAGAKKSRRAAGNPRTQQFTLRGDI